MAEAKLPSPTCRLAAGGCREGGEESSALNQMSVAGRYGRSLLRGLVLIPFCDGTDSYVLPWVGALLGESVQSKSGWVAGGYCPFHLGAVSLLCRKWWGFFRCMEVVGLRVTAVVFNHRDPHAIAMGYL